MIAAAAAMDALESALFLSHFYPTAATSFWTWIAVITAALSFWRITIVGSRSRLKSDASLLDQSPAVLTDRSAHPLPVAEVSTTAVCSSFPDPDDGLTKGKFTVYYEDDGVREEEGGYDGDVAVSKTCYGDDDDNDDDDDDDDCRVRLPVVRTVDWGWYRYQDLTALNGNVVRLWEYERRKTPTSKPDGSGSSMTGM